MRMIEIWRGMMFQSNQKSKCEKLYKNGKITFLIRILEISIQVKLQKNLQKEVFSYFTSKGRVQRVWPKIRDQQKRSRRKRKDIKMHRREILSYMKEDIFQPSLLLTHLMVARMINIFISENLVQIIEILWCIVDIIHMTRIYITWKW